MRLLICALALAAGILCVWGMLSAHATTASNDLVRIIGSHIHRISPRIDDGYNTLHGRIDGSERTAEEIEAAASFNRKWVAGGSLYSKIRVWNSTKSVQRSPVRLLCLLPIVGTDDTQLIASYGHWARRCDDVVAIGPRVVRSIPSRHLFVFDVPFGQGIFHFITALAINLRSRVQAADYVVIASREVYVIVDNLRYILGLTPLRRLSALGAPLTMGIRFVTGDDNVIPQKDMIIMSRTAVSLLGSIASTEHCGPRQPKEPLDLQIGRCFGSFGLYVWDLRDEYGENVLTYVNHDALVHRASNPDDIEDWVKRFWRRKYLPGAAGLSQRAVTLMGSIASLDLMLANQTVWW